MVLGSPTSVKPTGTSTSPFTHRPTYSQSIWSFLKGSITLNFLETSWKLKINPFSRSLSNCNLMEVLFVPEEKDSDRRQMQSFTLADSFSAWPHPNGILKVWVCYFVQVNHSKLPFVWKSLSKTNGILQNKWLHNSSSSRLLRDEMSLWGIY